jgi:hypothetical protein
MSENCGSCRPRPRVRFRNNPYLVNIPITGNNKHNPSIESQHLAGLVKLWTKQGLPGPNLNRYTLLQS